MDRETLTRLSQPLDKRLVRHLPQNAGPGKAGKPYLPGFEHTRTANQIFNFDWSCKVVDHGLAYCEEVEVQRGETKKRMWSVAYWALVEVTAAGVTHTGMGFCDNMAGSKADACSMAYPGAVTEGRKSALEQFGDRFGIGLRDDADPNGEAYSRELQVVPAEPQPLPAPSPSTAPSALAVPLPPPAASVPVAEPRPAPAQAVTPPPPPAQAPAAAANIDEAELRRQLDTAIAAFHRATVEKLGKGKGYLPAAVTRVGIAKPTDVRTYPVDRIPELLEQIRDEWRQAGLTTPKPAQQAA